jgi:hypothetical protein
MAGPETPSPAMSVVLVTPSGLEALGETIACLRAQTAVSRLELVVVGPELAARAARSSRLEVFASVVLVETRPARTTAEGLAAGVRRSTAPIVAFTEEHAFPEPDWAERLLQAHRGPWAAVGPAIVHRNPGTRTSAADYVLAFGRWAPQGAPGPATELAGHNSSYKRETLLSLGAELEHALAAECLLHGQLRARGAELYFEPAARTGHLVASSFRRWLPTRFERGRLIGASRARSFSRARRAVYVAGSPLIPFVRLGRLSRGLPPGAGWRQYGPGVTATVCLGAVVEAAGEAVGYARGEGSAERRLTEYELRRRAYLVPSDPERP